MGISRLQVTINHSSPATKDPHASTMHISTHTAHRAFSHALVLHMLPHNSCEHLRARRIWHADKMLNIGALLHATCLLVVYPCGEQQGKALGAASMNAPFAEILHSEQVRSNLLPDLLTCGTMSNCRSSSGHATPAAAAARGRNNRPPTCAFK